MTLRFRKRAGRCYEIAWKQLLSDERFADWRLVHGEARGPEDERIGHAWLEKGEELFDPVLNLFFANGEYRMRYAAVTLKAYDRLEAARIGATKEHFGPWP